MEGRRIGKKSLPIFVGCAIRDYFGGRFLFRFELGDVGFVPHFLVRRDLLDQTELTGSSSHNGHVTPHDCARA